MNRWINEGLGDIVSTEGDCKQGEAQVAQLRAMFAQLGSPPEFAAAVAAITSAYDEAEGSWSRRVPFTPVCGQIKGLGAQAAKLTSTMAQSAGVASPGDLGSPSPTDKLVDSFSSLIELAGFGLAAYLAVSLLSKRGGK